MKMLLATTAILSMAALGSVANAQNAAPAASSVAVPNNVLLADWSGPYDGVPPWDKVDPKLFSPAFEFGIAEQRREIDAIANNLAPATFENTIEAMEKTGQRFSRVENVFAVMTDNMSTPEYQALDKEWQPKMSAAFDEITFNEKLFQRVKSLYDRKASLGLNAVQDRLLTRTYDSFVRSGANLNAPQKAQLAKMNQELATLFSTFNERLLADESTYITATEAEMKGVPADVKAALAAAAKERKQPAGTYALKNTRSVADPILTFADDRGLREKVWRAFVNRGDNGNANDTNQIIAQILKLRAERAKLLGFKENTGTVPVFHPDVRTFEVTDQASGKVVGLFYLDNFAREGKRSGAWMTTYRSRAGLLGDDIVLASNNNNFTKGEAGKPVLISLDDAETLFHEFGHAINYLLINVRYPSLGGLQRDFVEYPSQVNENWLLTPEVLQRFAKHYQTGQPMPQALVDKIQKAQTFNQGFATVEYLGSALVDMKMHTDPNGVTDPDAFEKKALAEIGMPKEIVMRHRLPQFGHLFSSDAYSAGYYSYLWSETMDADTWAAFQEAGSPWDKTVAGNFKKYLLSTGNETDRAEAYRQFRGRDPDVNALLKKRGFPTN